MGLGLTISIPAYTAPTGNTVPAGTVLDAELIQTGLIKMVLMEAFPGENPECN